MQKLTKPRMPVSNGGANMRKKVSKYIIYDKNDTNFVKNNKNLKNHNDKASLMIDTITYCGIFTFKSDVDGIYVQDLSDKYPELLHHVVKVPALVIVNGDKYIVKYDDDILTSGQFMLIDAMGVIGVYDHNKELIKKYSIIPGNSGIKLVPYNK